MASRGFNAKTPTVKRILKEAAELASHPSRDFHAAPQDDNLFEWHFTLRGPPAPSPYASGIYHGRILLPATYPLKPPNFRFMTPTGRFEVNREICLSISGHHEETWQPAWGIRTALVAIRSFMDSEARGQVGGLECDRAARERMAEDSGSWRCAACGKSNVEILKESEEAAAEHEDGEEGKEDAVPEELRLAYRDQLDQNVHGDKIRTHGLHDVHSRDGNKLMEGGNAADSERLDGTAPASSTQPHSQPQTAPPASAPPPVRAPQPTRTTLAAAPALPVRRDAVFQQQIPDRSLQWIDTCIYGIVAALVFLVLKKFAS